MRAKSSLHTLRKPDKIKDDNFLNSRTIFWNQESPRSVQEFLRPREPALRQDWKFEKTNWTGLSSKIHWLYAFRKTAGRDNANLSPPSLELPESTAVISRCRRIRNALPFG